MYHKKRLYIYIYLYNINYNDYSAEDTLIELGVQKPKMYVLYIHIYIYMLDYPSPDSLSKI